MFRHGQMSFARLLSILLCLCFLFSAISCGAEEKPDDDPDDSEQSGENQDSKPPVDQGTTDETEDDKEPAVPLLTLKNKLALSPVTTRSYYPDHNAFLTKLYQIKGALEDQTINDSDTLFAELLSAMRIAERLGVYYDYYNHTNYTDGDVRYGAALSDKPIGGGGEAYASVKKYQALASNDDMLHDSFSYLKPGEVLLVTGYSVIDLSDFLLAGEITGFAGERIDFQWEVKQGATWIGERGVNHSGGAILKVTSRTNCAILVGENARLSGLCIQGPDSEVDKQNADANFSVGIIVKGDGAVIENCEISGFYRTGIQVIDSENVTIRNNYFHDIGSLNTGYAVFLNNSSAEIYGNLFANVTTMVASNGGNTNLQFHDNMDAGNVTGPYFKLLPCGGKDAAFSDFRVGVSSVSIHHNTFLSLADLFVIDGLPAALSVENNLFAYPEFAYDWSALKFDKVGGAILNERVAFQNNAFDIQKPLVLSKSSTSEQTPSNQLLGAFSTLISDQLVPFVIEEKSSLSVNYKTTPKLPVLSSCYYTDNDDAGYLILAECLLKTKFSASLSKNIGDAIAKIGNYSNYVQFEDAGLISIEANGEKYGAYSDGDPIGGGIGYSKIYTTGDFVVTTERELKTALHSAKAGQVVFIPGGTYINISDASKGKVNTLTIPAGVILASDRGYVRPDGTVSTGAVIASSVVVATPMIKIGGENARITGLVLKGPDPARHVNHGNRSLSDKSNSLMVSYYWLLPNVRGVECGYSNVTFDNLEVSGFNTIAINFSNSQNPPKNGLVSYCYMHHNQLAHLGYGVKFGHGYADVTYNMFNYNRHSISGAGEAKSGFLAAYNIEMGESLGHYFDMHGGVDRKDGTDIAGEYMDMKNNSFLGSSRPYYQRGYPTDHQDFSYNVVYEAPAFYGAYLSHYKGQPCQNVTVGKNIWNIVRENTNPTSGL